MISAKFYLDDNGWLRYHRSTAENFNWLSRAYERYRRHMTAYSECEHIPYYYLVQRVSLFPSCTESLYAAYAFGTSCLYKMFASVSVR